MKYICFWYFCSKCKQRFSNWLLHLPEVGVSALSRSKNAWFRSKNARFCSKNFSTLMLEIARWSLEIFLWSKCSTIFPLEIARIEISKSKMRSRSLGSKNPMLKMLEIDVFAARSQLYLKVPATESNFKLISLISVRWKQGFVPTSLNWLWALESIFRLIFQQWANFD